MRETGGVSAEPFARAAHAAISGYFRKLEPTPGPNLSTQRHSASRTPRFHARDRPGLPGGPTSQRFSHISVLVWQLRLQPIPSPRRELVLRQLAAEALDRVEREYGGLGLVVRVEMWTMMLATRLNEHPNDDSEES